MNVTTDIRIKYYTALAGIKQDGVEIPVFDEFVNPNTAIPTIRGAEVYIVLQGQQTFDSAVQNYCEYNVDGMITVRVVTKFKGLSHSKILCEDIAKQVDGLIRDGRDGNKINVNDVKLEEGRVISEESGTSTAYTYVLMYRNKTKQD